MQKGHLQRTVPVLLVTILALGFVVTTGSAGPGNGAASSLIPLVVTTAADRGLVTRPIIGHELPPLPVLMQTQQSSGPDPDSNLTPTGAASEELQPNGSPGSTQNRIAFSSNGTDSDDDGQIDAVLPPNANLNLWIMQSDGQAQYQVTSMSGDEVDPAYDPGGRLLAFAAKVSNVWQIFTVEIRDPSIIRQITSGPGNKRHPTWSRDRNYIVFQSDVNGNWDIYKIASTGAGSPVQLTVGSDDDTDPAYSPTSDVIAFTRSSGGVKRIYTVDGTGGNLTPITNGGGDATASDTMPAWRLNGTEIAFASNRLTEAGDTVNDYNIWRMAPAGEPGGATATLVSNTDVADTADDLNPTYTQEIQRTPTRIVFESFRAGDQPDIWGVQLRDWIPPVLTALPSVDNRLHTPGDDVVVSAPVYDKDSGVANVVAIFKDPDNKQYAVSTTSFDSSIDGDRYLEIDYAPVGSVVLTDDDNDGVYTGSWTTPSAPHDYVIDISVTDNAGNSITYDDVYGFSTRQFAPRNPVLFVNDYCEGQLFLSQLGFNNDFPAAFPVESYYTSNPGFAPDALGTIDFDTIQGGTQGGYDVWRIICRGPVPAHVYQYYLPTIEYQLDPAKLDSGDTSSLKAERPVAVADRAVIWAAPHCGDVWIADGSVLDASTQADLALFVRRGGRLMISGENLGYALTMDGTRSNSFFSQTLRATYIRDVAIGSDFGLGGAAGDPVAVDPWGGGHEGNWPRWYDSDDAPNELHTCRWTRPANQPWYMDCAEWSQRPDLIGVSNAIQIYGYNADESTSFTDQVAGLRYEDTTIANGGRVVYLAFGFEQIHRGYHTVDNFTHCQNHRSHLVHNALCWMRTGGFQGRVVSISDGGQPVNDPAPIVQALQGGQVVYAVRCQKDGSYIMQGLPPGFYTLRATRPGYEIDHAEGGQIHGGQVPVIQDFAIKGLQPGAVTGTVTALSDGAPLANVLVSIAPAPDDEGNVPTVPGLPNPVRTAADGTYTLPYVPPGDYIVTADGADILYGKDDADVTVVSGDTVTADFALAAADGTLVATVTDVDTGQPIENASVAAEDKAGVTFEAFTDEQGVASQALSPGVYTVVVAGPGYQASAAQSVQISPAQETAIAVALKREPPGAITGRVVSTSGNYVGDVLIVVKFGSREIAQAVTSASAIDAAGNNYKVTDVPTGTVTVSASRTGFTASPDPHPPVLVQSGLTTKDVNFTMSSLHTFPRGLQLISFPADYSNTDPADLLGVARSQFKMATYETSRQRYQEYPNAPADRFRVGTGYWLRLSQAADLSDEGMPVADPVELNLVPGWNLIGTPFNERIDFFQIRVRRSGQSVLQTMQDATSSGVIGSGLFAYVLGGYQSVGTMAPYIGYWLRANEPCTLVIASQSGSAGAGPVAERPGVLTPEGGWLLQLRASAAGLQDTSAYMGAAPKATKGTDNGLDQAKPPVPAMGPYVYAGFADDDWSSDDRAVDVRALNQGTVWNVRVRTNLVGQRIALTWPETAGLPAGVRPVLTDLNTGERVYMRTASGYSFTARSEEQRLQITVEPAGTGQLVITSQGAVNTGGGVSVGYVLSQAAQVDVVVTNLAGRTVRRISAGQLQTAGRHEILWDGRSDGGVRVPGGRYFVTLTARTQVGQAARAMVPVLYQSR